MNEPFRLMCVVAHPDDESLGTGGILAKYATEGHETYLVTATCGQRGWPGDPDDYPGSAELCRIREAELRAAGEVLGLREIVLLGYRDGELDQAEPAEVIAKIVTHLRRVQPQVVVTFGPDGAYGHPDHIAISQFTTAAVVAAANASYRDVLELPHQVSKLYYMAITRAELDAYEAAMGDLVMQVDGAERRSVAWEPWAVTTWIDTAAHWEQVWQAVACHRTQLPTYEALTELSEEQHQYLWGTQTFYRAFSLVNGGRQVERDLFAGLRERS
ncbi:MAG: PIG-L family deacetylase [Chloroflexota bacterium]|nr:PIG-L family deacetylase [Chloroflexota bacterium]